VYLGGRVTGDITKCVGTFDKMFWGFRQNVSTKCFDYICWGFRQNELGLSTKCFDKIFRQNVGAAKGTQKRSTKCVRIFDKMFRQNISTKYLKQNHRVLSVILDFVEGLGPSPHISSAFCRAFCRAFCQAFCWAHLVSTKSSAQRGHKPSGPIWSYGGMGGDWRSFRRSVSEPVS